MTVVVTTALTSSFSEARTAKLAEHQTPAVADSHILTAILSSIEARDVRIDEMSSGPHGSWFIVANGGTEITASAFVPLALTTKVEELTGQGKKIDTIVMSPNDGVWAVVAEDRYERSPTFPADSTFDAQITDFISNHEGVRDIAISEDGLGWLVVAKDNTVASHNMVGPMEAVEEAQKSGRQIREVENTSAGSWLVVTDNWYASHGLFPIAGSAIEEFQREEWALDEVMIMPDGSFMFYSHAKVSPGNGWIDKLEYDLRGGGNIFTQMERDHIPGISIATIEDGVITTVRSYGSRIAHTPLWTRTSTRFVIASVTKNIVNSGVRILERDHPDRFSLDKDLKVIKSENPDGQLAKWIDAVEGDELNHWGIPEEEYKPFPSRVTARKIINNKAGFTGYSPDPFWITPASACTGNVEPSQWLLGFNCVDGFPNANKAVWSYLDPDLDDDDVKFKYATSAWNALLAIAEDIHPGDAGYPQIWRELVFGPAQMTRTTFDHNEINADPAVAYIHNRSGVPRSAPVLRAGPGGGGLYSTAEDLAKYILWLQAEGLAPNGRKNVTGSAGRGGFGVNSKWDMNFTTGHGVVVLMNGRGEILNSLVERYFVPEAWTCSPDYYKDKEADFCDCGCGVKDPDCSSSDVDACHACNTPGACSENELGCRALVPDQNWQCLPTVDPPPQWTCHERFYDNSDGCDCGCGAPDPDCDDSTQGSCDWCNVTGSCADAVNDCTPIDELENWKCAEEYCTPNCSGRSCGSDGCGGQCGACPRGEVCDTGGQCSVEVVCAATPWEAEAAYVSGDTVSVGGYEYQAWYWNQGQNPTQRSGAQSSGKPWGAPVHCATGCSPSCDERSCGDDGCGGSCGACDHGDVCNVDGQCQAPSACEAAAWRESGIYEEGDRVSVGDVEYEAWHWTQGQNPLHHSGPQSSGLPWGEGVACP